MEFHCGRLIDHVHLRVADLEASKRFYRAVLNALGRPEALVEADGYFHADELFVDQADGPVSRVHLAFQASDRAAVDAFHRAALEAGGRDHGGPGERAYHPGYFGAFVLDPDGNNVEAVFHGAAARSAGSVRITAVERVQLPSGITLPYVAQGDPSGLPVIFLHGFSDSWFSFSPVLSLLPAWIRAIAVTQRGHGDADRPEDYRTRDFADDVVALLDALRIDRAVVVGHSMGSYNAARFAIDHPQRVLGLVLVGAFASFGDNPAVAELVQVVSQLSDPVDAAFVREFQQSTLAQPVSAEFLDAVVDESRKLPARVWRAVAAGLVEDGVAGQFGRVGAPTLILWGAQDAFSPRADQDKLVEAIPGAELRVYEAAGHAPHWEDPLCFTADLVRFVRRLGGGGPQ